MHQYPSSQGNKESTLSSKAQQMEILTRRVLDLMGKNNKSDNSDIFVHTRKNAHDNHTGRPLI